MSSRLQSPLDYSHHRPEASCCWPGGRFCRDPRRRSCPVIRLIVEGSLNWQGFCLIVGCFGIAVSGSSGKLVYLFKCWPGGRACREPRRRSRFLVVFLVKSGQKTKNQPDLFYEPDSWIPWTNLAILPPLIGVVLLPLIRSSVLGGKVRNPTALDAIACCYEIK